MTVHDNVAYVVTAVDRTVSGFRIGRRQIEPIPGKPVANDDHHVREFPTIAVRFDTSVSSDCEHYDHSHGGPPGESTTILQPETQSSVSS